MEELEYPKILFLTPSGTRYLKRGFRNNALYGLHPTEFQSFLDPEDNRYELREVHTFEDWVGMVRRYKAKFNRALRVGYLALLSEHEEREWVNIVSQMHEVNHAGGYCEYCGRGGRRGGYPVLHAKGTQGS